MKKKETNISNSVKSELGWEEPAIITFNKETLEKTQASASGGNCSNCWA